jgi:hypothetical protein
VVVTWDVNVMVPKEWQARQELCLGEGMNDG